MTYYPPGKPVVVDLDNARVYGPFRTWADAEWFSETYSGGQFGIVNLTNPNDVKPSQLWKERVPQVALDIPQYTETGQGFTRGDDIAV